MIMMVVSRTTISCAPAMTTRIHQWARVGGPEVSEEPGRVFRSVTKTALHPVDAPPDGHGDRCDDDVRRTTYDGRSAGERSY